MNLHANDRNTNKTHRKWIRGRRKRGNWTILDISPLSSSFFLHPPPFLLTRIMFHFRCGLSPLFWLFSGFLSCFLSLPVPLCQLVWCQCSRTPPLTDNSLDGTLLRTAQCTAILPQWAPDLWWMESVTPSTLSGTSQTEKWGAMWSFS